MAASINRTEEAESALKLHNDGLSNIKMEWLNVGIQPCADDVVKELAKVYHKWYDFALDKLNLPVDQEFRMAVERPDESSDDEEEGEKLAEGPKDGQNTEDPPIEVA